jgi:hypothetical protein
MIWRVVVLRACEMIAAHWLDFFRRSDGTTLKSEKFQWPSTGRR